MPSVVAEGVLAPTESDLLFSHAGDLSTPSVGAELRAVSVGYDSEPISLWTTADRSVVSRGMTGEHQFELQTLGARFPLIQKLPDDRVLVCDARTRANAPSAWIFSGDGKLLTAGSLGDGIAHVCATEGGLIWVGYFDEGVYGGSKIAQHGIVRFNGALEPEWEYPLNSAYGSIDDCYSLNLDGDVAWSCYYGGFPIVRIERDEVDGWQGAPSGPNGLLVRGNEALTIGGFAEDHNRVVRLSLGPDGVATVVSEGRALGIPVSARHIRICRGADAYLFLGPQWFRATM